jgi:hypothetical protein
VTFRSEHRLAVARSVKGFMPEPEGLALYRAAIVATRATGATGATRATGATGATGAARAGVGPPWPLLEIGTYCAKSAVYLGAAAEEAATVLFSVDHHRGSEENQAGWEHHDPAVVDPASGRMDTLPWARRTIEQAGLEGSVVLLVGPSAIIAAHWSTPLSLLFIDGGHGREVAWADYSGWSPKVAPGGLLAIHDVFPDPADGGRPPFELYCDALASGCFDDCPELASGSLRVLRRRPAPVARGYGPAARDDDAAARDGARVARGDRPAGPDDGPMANSA